MFLSPGYVSLDGIALKNSINWTLEVIASLMTSDTDENTAGG